MLFIRKAFNSSLCKRNKLAHINIITPPKPFYCFSSRKDWIFTVSLVGKPNVGKSSLFNMLALSRKALTDNIPGLTRDRKETISYILGTPVRLVDTAGIDLASKSDMKEKEMYAKILEQTSQALIYTDLVLFVVDAREGISTLDTKLAHWLHKQKSAASLLPVVNKSREEKSKGEKKILLVANKAENESFDPSIYSDVYQLGFGTPLMVSAEHGDGIQDLLRMIQKELPPNYADQYENLRIKRMEKHLAYRNKLKQEILELKGSLEEESGEKLNIAAWEREFDLINRNPEDNSDLDSDSEINPLDTLNTESISVKTGVTSENLYYKKPIKLSVIGRPNVGKSTFVNTLLHENRVVVDDLPGTTRDSISLQWNYKGRKIDLVDTAGIEKSANIRTEHERNVVADTNRAIRLSHIIICMIDAGGSMKTHDLSMVQDIVKEGRGLIIAINKWDLVPQEYRQKVFKYIKKQIEKALGGVKGLPLFYISAKTGFKVDELMDEVLKVYQKWNIRISTGLLNNWLKKFKKLQSMPSEDGKHLKIRYISQIKSRPPTFAVFVNDEALFKQNYLKFMRAKLSEEFGMQGLPIRLIIRDVAYKKEKRMVEKQETLGRKIKTSFLRRRRLAKLAKSKLDRLNKQMM